MDFKSQRRTHTPVPVQAPIFSLRAQSRPKISSSSSLHPVRRRRAPSGGPASPRPVLLPSAGTPPAPQRSLRSPLRRRKARGATTPSRGLTASRASVSSSFAATPSNLPPPPSTPHAATSSPASARIFSSRLPVDWHLSLLLG